MEQQNIVIIGCCRSGHNFVREQIKTWDKREKYNIYNLDDFDPRNYHQVKHLIHYKGIPMDHSKPTIAIIVTRGLLNWWASYIMWITDKNTRPIREANIINELQAWKNQIQAPKIEEIDTWNIKFEDFTMDHTERSMLANMLLLRHDDSTIHKRATQGRGSCFEGWLDVSKRSDTQKRYTQIHNGALYKLYIDTLTARPDLIEAYIDNFEVPKDERDFINRNLK